MRKEIYAYDKRQSAVIGLIKAEDRGASINPASMKAVWPNGDCEFHRVLNHPRDEYNVRGITLTAFHIKGNIPLNVIETLEAQVR